MTIHSFSKGIVLFLDGTYLTWGHADGHQVIKWVQFFDSPKSDHARQHGGVFYACVIHDINAEVIYEWQKQ